MWWQLRRHFIEFSRGWIKTTKFSKYITIILSPAPVSKTAKFFSFVSNSRSAYSNQFQATYFQSPDRFSDGDDNTVSTSSPIWSHVREAFKKKNPKKFGNFPNRGGGSWPNPNFFLDFFGFFLKPLGKHWKWPDSSRNAKKKISLLWGGVVPCTVQYRTVQNCTVQ